MNGSSVAALEYCEPEVRLAGGTYVDVEPTGVCVDGNLVSAKGWIRPVNCYLYLCYINWLELVRLKEPAALRLNERLRQFAKFTAVEDEIHGALSLKLSA